MTKQQESELQELMDGLQRDARWLESFPSATEARRATSVAFVERVEAEARSEREPIAIEPIEVTEADTALSAHLRETADRLGEYPLALPPSLIGLRADR